MNAQNKATHRPRWIARLAVGFLALIVVSQMTGPPPAHAFGTGTSATVTTAATTTTGPKLGPPEPAVLGDGVVPAAPDDGVAAADTPAAELAAATVEWPPLAEGPAPGEPAAPAAGDDLTGSVGDAAEPMASVALTVDARCEGCANSVVSVRNVPVAVSSPRLGTRRTPFSFSVTANAYVTMVAPSAVTLTNGKRLTFRAWRSVTDSRDITTSSTLRGTANKTETLAPVYVLPGSSTKVTVQVQSRCDLCSAVPVTFSGLTIGVYSSSSGDYVTPFSLTLEKGSTIGLLAPDRTVAAGKLLRFKHWYSDTEQKVVEMGLLLSRAASKSETLVAVYDPQPLTTVRVHAVRVADDPEHAYPVRQARITPDQVRRWLDKASEVYAPARVQFAFTPDESGPDWTDIQDTVINSMEGVDDVAPNWTDEKARANAEAAKHPGKLVIFFRWGRGRNPDRSEPTGGGFSWTDYNFVAMPGFDTNVCGVPGNQNIGLQPHEIGHYLGLPHPFANDFATKADAEAYLTAHGNNPQAFDGDGFSDTEPDPFFRKDSDGSAIDCGPTPASVTLNGIVFKLPRTNVMTYYHYQYSVSTEVRTLTPQQILRVREWLEIRGLE